MMRAALCGLFAAAAIPVVAHAGDPITGITNTPPPAVPLPTATPPSLTLDARLQVVVKVTTKRTEKVKVKVRGKGRKPAKAKTRTLTTVTETTHDVPFALDNPCTSEPFSGTATIHVVADPDTIPPYIKLYTKMSGQGIGGVTLLKYVAEQNSQEHTKKSGETTYVHTRFIRASESTTGVLNPPPVGTKPGDDFFLRVRMTTSVNDLGLVELGEMVPRIECQ